MTNPGYQRAVNRASDLVRKNVNSVQWLRGIAALMVVLHHARNPKPWLFNPLEGFNGFALGVDIFFVISGFIMFVAARGERPTTFLRRRLIRVVPLYWLATIALVLLSYRLDIFGLRFHPDELVHILKSLFFIPHYSTSSPDQIYPFLIPGWTLNYEMFFYLIFLLGLTVKRPMLVTTVIISFLVGLGTLVGSTDDPVIKTYTSFQMLEFVAGIAIGWLYSRDLIPHSLVMLLPVGFIGLLVSQMIPFEMTVRLLSSSMILIGTIAADRYFKEIRLLGALGDSSYSLYLSHTIIGLPIATRIMTFLPISGWVQFLSWMMLAAILSAMIGYLVHRLVEKPVLSWLRKALDASPRRLT